MCFLPILKKDVTDGKSDPFTLTFTQKNEEFKGNASVPTEAMVKMVLNGK